MPDVFHITHVTNLPSIIAEGALYCDEARRQGQVTPVRIGYTDLKDRRARTEVPVPPGGMLSEYVPFYFGPRSPMLYTINRGNVPGYGDGQGPLVHLVADSYTIEAAGHDVVFTDGHPVILLSEFSNDLSQIPDMVDLPLMGERYWYDTDDDPDRKRRRQAELLVHRQLSFESIHRIGVMSQDTAILVDQALDGLAQAPEVAVERGWYY